MKVLIVGGVAGGATVAARLRRVSEEVEIILFERGEHVSYANCGLPYYIGGAIETRDRLFLQTVEGFWNRFKVDVRICSDVTKIDPKIKTIFVTNTQTGKSYSEQYDKLVLSTGAEPIRPAISGIDNPLIFTLRNVTDMDRIKDHINAFCPQKAVVVGGGFIGLEMIENLFDAGINTTLVEMGNQVMAPLDFSMASIVHQELIQKGITLLLEEAVNGFEKREKGLTILLKSGKKIETDFVIWSIGVRPETKLAKEAMLSIGETGGIEVNDFMQTSDPDIYSLGDATEVLNPIINKKVLIPLAGPANKQGRIVADNILEGNKQRYKGTIGTSIAKIFDLTVAAAGVSAKMLKREKIDFRSSFTHSSSHAGYYPNALPLSLKLLFSPQNGVLLGAQVVGFEGVDKRIEMLAQVIQKKGTIVDLMELEHAYAPPYSSAKDPVNMAGFVANNIMTSKMKPIYWREIATLDPQQSVIIDVRTAQEFALNRILGAINIPVDELRKNLDQLPKDKKLILYCAIGLRGYLAARILSQNGFKEVFNLSGGYKTYQAATQEIENRSVCEDKSTIMKTKSDIETKITSVVDACGLQCPGPILQLKQAYDLLNEGETVEIKSTDQAFGADVSSWCNMVGANLRCVEQRNGIIYAQIEKRSPQTGCGVELERKNKTIVVFSDDLDKALAAFVIANGAASTGQKVSLFFTFWGLSVIKKRQKPAVSKDVLGKLFSFMLPSSSKKLSLSKINMGGLGSLMMRYVMRKKNIDSLEKLIQQAVESHVEMIACSMSMDVMGVKKEELMENVTIGGVAAYLERTERASLNLFI